jgi:hypothetical protein
VALALTIPGEVDGQDLHSVHPEPDGVTFQITFGYNDTAQRLMLALQRGEKFELLVLTTDAGILALDGVYVTSASVAGGEQPEFYGSLQAEAVRFF